MREADVQAHAAAIVVPLFSISVDMFFGLNPASKTSKLNPMEALRHEECAVVVHRRFCLTF